METYNLAKLMITQGTETIAITFKQAKLRVISEYGSRLWFIEVDGINDQKLLKQYADSEDISIGLQTTTIDGVQFEGRAFFHPNPQHHAAAIRGDGQLIGYEQ